MSNKRKILLCVTVAIIAICYICALSAIFNHSDTPPKQTVKNYTKPQPQKTDYQPQSRYHNSDNQTTNINSTYNKKENILSSDYLDSYFDETNTKSKYKGNQLSNGNTPFDACFGKGIYNGNATLTIKNGASSDAIVCLYSIDLNRTIRNEYIRKNTSFKMDNIAQGYYKIRVLYGNDWNPEYENFCGTKGNFESNVSFSEFDGTEYFEDSEDGYTVATVTLYTVTGGNASTSKISQSEFFGN